LLGFGICGTVLLVSGWLVLPGTEQGVADAAAVFCTFVLGAWLAGLVVRDRSRLVRELREVNRRLIEERDAAARRVVLDERARVAHELHDVIGHSLTVIVLQAGAARRVWETDRAAAHRHLATIARVGSESLNELLRSLAILNVGYSIAGCGVQRFEDMLEMARLAGVRVELRVRGEAVRLSPSAELAAYRMVQEALTNAMKHAPGAPVQLCVRYLQEALELEVRNALVAAPPNGPLTSGGGHGLVGLRQRIQACGGALEWNCKESAFCVRARLPVLG
jgi:signal transduction histidine kinase